MSHTTDTKPPESHLACERCFGYPELRDRFKTIDSKPVCYWCGARSVKVLPLHEFGQEFRRVVSQLYEPDESGALLVDLLLEDWPRLLGPCFRLNHQHHRGPFLIAVLEAGLSRKELFTLGLDFGGRFSRKPTTLVDDWWERIERAALGRSSVAQGSAGTALRTGSTTSPLELGEPMMPSEQELVLEDLSCELPVGSVLFRARIHQPSKRNELFVCEELHAPPKEHAEAGRANGKGEPVLYLASDINTAIAEVRAFRGSAVAVGSVRVIRSARIIDTVGSTGLVSPFECDCLQRICDLRGVLGRFGWQLSRPILRGERELGYRPTQHLAEFIRNCGYAGIKYPSAMGTGHNVVLFCPADAVVESVSYYRVRAVMVNKRPLGACESPYEDGPYNSIFESA